MILDDSVVVSESLSSIISQHQILNDQSLQILSNRSGSIRASEANKSRSLLEADRGEGVLMPVVPA